jgi:hypothetical protein
MGTQITTERDQLVDQLTKAQARHAEITAITAKAQDAALAAVLRTRDLEYGAQRGALLTDGPELAAAKATEYEALSQLESARLHLSHATSAVERAEAARVAFDANERRERQAVWIAANRPELAEAIADAEAEVARLRQPVIGPQPDGQELSFAIGTLDKARAALEAAIDEAPTELELVHAG